MLVVRVAHHRCQQADAYPHVAALLQPAGADQHGVGVALGKVRTGAAVARPGVPAQGGLQRLQGIGQRGQAAGRGAGMVQRLIPITARGQPVSRRIVARGGLRKGAEDARAACLNSRAGCARSNRLAQRIEAALQRRQSPVRRVVRGHSSRASRKPSSTAAWVLRAETASPTRKSWKRPCGLWRTVCGCTAVSAV